MKTFHGSYADDDVRILINPINVTGENVETLRCTTGGDIDYPTLIASEAPPSPQYMRLFFEALSLNKERIARDVLKVARALAAHPGNEIVLVSLVRAGTPVGVLIHRALKMLGANSVHYAISATRKRGADPSALDEILKRHSGADLYFVDGWTGKGFIFSELSEALTDYNRTRATLVMPRLVVLADLAGVSYLSASSDDYLIPAAMLRSIVCGLISASMVNPDPSEDALPDACLYYDFLSPYDVSRQFVDEIALSMRQALAGGESASALWEDAQRASARCVSQRFVEEMMSRYGIGKSTSIKPGICEAFRALLTRSTEMTLLVTDLSRGDSTGLFILAQNKGVEVILDPSMPYRAAVLLKG